MVDLIKVHVLLCHYNEASFTVKIQVPRLHHLILNLFTYKNETALFISSGAFYKAKL